MVKFLIIQVRLGKIAIKDIPEKYRADVERALEVDKYESN